MSLYKKAAIGLISIGAGTAMISSISSTPATSSEINTANLNAISLPISENNQPETATSTSATSTSTRTIDEKKPAIKEIQNRTESNSCLESGATAQCNDMSCSYAANHRGACSHHGGVRSFYK